MSLENLKKALSLNIPEENETTDPILRSFSERIFGKGLKGSLILHTLGRENRKYVSTLDDKYWNTETGQDLLHIVEKHRPDIYLELHSYSDPSKLTDSDRIDRKGVPPLIELESGILAGSISPKLRRSKFRKEDFCFLLEIPRKKDHHEDIFEILKIIGQGTSSFSIAFPHIRSGARTNIIFCFIRFIRFPARLGRGPGQ